MIENKKINIVFMGPPGVGKGTVASVISKENNIIHLSTGNIFREAIASKSELGLKVAQIVESGKYVPDEITNEIVKNKLQEFTLQNKQVMLDGYPRTIEQVYFLDKINDFNYVAVELYAPDELILKRLSGRRQCPQCKSNFHIDFMPSKNGEFCDKCNAKLITRKDDEVSAIKVRQEVYHKQTAPLLEYYKKEKRLISFDASGKPEDIAKRIVKKVFKN
ncbi:adenylate kinase family protein [Mycoplasmopsis lipofaciens]|uniref:adenylate kinase family protein n=1 Tax=Mycoplasmopsis lipofaciens TaxID=114884 RepID=UPI000483DD59|nr:nucleoside monophosphate kinase [Mycoplasmopsis lipofaciens]